MLTLELGNSSNWNLIYEQSATAVKLTDTSYTPIPEIPIPFLLNARFMAFSVTSAGLPSYYRYAGQIRQKFRAGMMSGGGQDIELNNAYRLYLKQINLVELKQYGAETALIYYPPYYFEQVSLSVWEYTGSIIETVDNSLNAIQSDVRAIKNVLIP
jgi:hypothetical protein